MPVTLYGVAESPPCRSVLIVAEAIGLPLEVHTIDLRTSEHLTPEYRKINLLRTVPSLEDDGTILVDSHAIIAYLVSKYAKDDSLYPKDLKKRALVDSKLHFDNGYAFSILIRAFREHLYGGQTEALTSKQIKEIEDVYDFTNQFLEGNKWITGDTLTIADISLFTTITSLDTMLPIDNSKYSNLRRWLNDAETLPYFKVNKKGLEDHKESWETIIAR